MAAPKHKAPVEPALPRFVVLEDNFGWMENGCLMTFKADQIVREPSMVRALIEHGAPLIS